MLGLFAMCRSVNPKGSPALHVDAAHPQWIAELQDERRATATFRRLYAKANPNKLAYLSGFDVAEAHLLPTVDGFGMAVGLERSFWLCANGLRYHHGGITAPDFGDQLHDAVVLFDAAGRPTQVFWASLALVDANGDGRVNEVIRAPEHFYGDNKPAVTIMNIDDDEVSLAFALEFNANAPVSVVADNDPGWGVTSHEYVLTRTSEGPTLGPIRYGGWSFAPNAAGYNDIVVYETVDGVSRKVAHFPYSPEEQRWLYPDDIPTDALWSVPTTVAVPLRKIPRGGLLEPPTTLAVRQDMNPTGVSVW